MDVARNNCSILNPRGSAKSRKILVIVVIVVIELNYQTLIMAVSCSRRASRFESFASEGCPEPLAMSVESGFAYYGVCVVRPGSFFSFVFSDQKIQLECGRGGPPRAYSLVSPVEKYVFSA